MVASLEEAVRTVSRWDYETRFVRPTGEVMYVRCLSQTRRQGCEIVFHGILLDVTEQRLAEEAQRESHRHLQRNMLFLEAMLSAIPTPVFFKDTAGRYLGCNQAFSDLFGISAAELRGKTAYEILPEKLAQVHHGKDLELLQNPKIQTYEWKVRDKDRQMRDVIFGKNNFRTRTARSRASSGRSSTSPSRNALRKSSPGTGTPWRRWSGAHRGPDQDL
jgi:PAS domain S-box-containing protein